MEDETVNKVQDIIPPEIAGEATETQKEDVKFDQAYFEWDGMEYERQEKNLRWFAAAGFVSLILLAYIIYTRDWFMIAVIVLVDIFFVFYLKRKPVKRHYRLTKLGLYVDDLFHPFDEMHSFWVVFNDSVKMLNFVFLKRYIPVFSVYLNDIDPLKVRNFLKDILPEQEKRGELFVDKLLRILKI